MSKLKFPFKFKHVLSGNPYTAKLDPNSEDLVLVEWENENGDLRCVDYTMSQVGTYVAIGSWYDIVHEVSATDNSQEVYDEMFDRIELLESLLVDANKRIAELEAQQTSKEFKSISEMTLEDWEQAKREHAVFVTNEGRETIIEDIYSYYIFFDFYVYGFTLDGKHSIDPDEYYITERIR